LYFFAAAGIAAASGQAPTRSSQASVVAALHAAGMRVERRGKVDQPLLSATGKVIKADGGEIQVFEYRDASQAEANAARVSGNGRTIGTAKVHWLAPPHFYKKDRLIVLYIGSNERVVKALEAALGPQFAGD
jgi:hypothetical protein